MKRDIPIKVFLTQEESIRLFDKANAAGMSEQQLIRALLKDYHPKRKPDDSFYETRTRLLAILRVLNVLEKKPELEIEDKAQIHIVLTDIEDCIAALNKEYLGDQK